MRQADAIAYAAAADYVAHMPTRQQRCRRSSDAIFRPLCRIRDLIDAAATRRCMPQPRMMLYDLCIAPCRHAILLFAAPMLARCYVDADLAPPPATLRRRCLPLYAFHARLMASDATRAAAAAIRHAAQPLPIAAELRQAADSH